MRQSMKKSGKWEKTGEWEKDFKKIQARNLKNRFLVLVLAWLREQKQSSNPLRESDLFLYLAQSLIGEVLCLFRVILNDTVQIVLVLAQIRKTLLQRS